MEIVDLGLEPGEVPAHSNITSLFVSFSLVPALNSHSVQSGQGARSVGSTLAVKKDRIIGRIIHDFEVFRDCRCRNQRPGKYFVHWNLDIIHAQILDQFGFAVILGTKVDDGFEALLRAGIRNRPSSAVPRDKDPPQPSKNGERCPLRCLRAPSPRPRLPEITRGKRLNGPLECDLHLVVVGSLL